MSKAPIRRVTAIIVGLLLVGGLLSGCQVAHLPNTKIAATDESRAIYKVVMAYQAAMETRDPDSLMSLVSLSYYENRGTTETDKDDYGYDKLKEQVSQHLTVNVIAVRYQILLTAIAVDGESATADYEYRAQFKFVEGGQEGWSQRNDFNRIELTREDEGWKIIAGL